MRQELTSKYIGKYLNMNSKAVSDIAKTQRWPYIEKSGHMGTSRQYIFSELPKDIQRRIQVGKREFEARQWNNNNDFE